MACRVIVDLTFKEGWCEKIRAMLEDGSMVMTPHNGTFTRSGTSIQIYFTAATSTGVVNFVVWDVDLLTKQVGLKYWEVKSPE